MQRADSLENTLMLGKIVGKRRRGWQRMRWLDKIADSMDMNLSKLREIVEDRETWHAVVQGVVKSRIRLREWTTTTKLKLVCFIKYVWITDDSLINQIILWTSNWFWEILISILTLSYVSCILLNKLLLWSSVSSCEEWRSVLYISEGSFSSAVLGCCGANIQIRCKLNI